MHYDNKVCKPVDKPFTVVDIDKTVKLRRRIEDYLRKYATPKQLDQVADLLNIKR